MNNFSVFLRLLWRDFYIYFRHLKNYLINYSIIYPVLFSLSFGYIIPYSNFEPGSLPSIGILLAGSITFIFVILPVAFNIFLLLDLEGDKFIEYQVLMINPRLLILEKILFSSLFTFTLLLPFFGISKLILQDYFNTSNLSIEKLILILFLSSLACCSYVVMAMYLLKNSHQLGSWWRRINGPFLILGGSWTPWFAIFKFSSVLAYFILLNPIIYINEGIRGSILGETDYIPFIYCIIGLVISSSIFIFLAFYFFKKRIDHI